MTAAASGVTDSAALPPLAMPPVAQAAGGQVYSAWYLAALTALAVVGVLVGFLSGVVLNFALGLWQLC